MLRLCLVDGRRDYLGRDRMDHACDIHLDHPPRERRRQQQSGNSKHTTQTLLTIPLSGSLVARLPYRANKTFFVKNVPRWFIIKIGKAMPKNPETTQESVAGASPARAAKPSAPRVPSSKHKKAAVTAAAAAAPAI